MATLSEVQRQADQLSEEDRDGLISYLLYHREGAPVGIDDSEVLEREREMDAGVVQTISQEEFWARVDRAQP